MSGDGDYYRGNMLLNFNSVIFHIFDGDLLTIYTEGGQLCQQVSFMRKQAKSADLG